MFDARAPHLLPAAYGPLNTAAIRNAPCQMSLGERLFLYTMVYATRPAHYCEIGTAQGGSAIIAAAAIADAGVPGAIMSLVDLVFSLDKAAEQMLRPRAVFFEGRSVEQFPLAAARGAPDFLLIDGDHSHEGTLADLELAAELVAPGAHILVHDAYNPPIAAAIDRARTQPEFIDVGFVCQHGNHLNAGQPIPDGPWAGQPSLWGGIYYLRRRS